MQCKPENEAIISAYIYIYIYIYMSYSSVDILSFYYPTNLKKEINALFKNEPIISYKTGTTNICVQIIAKIVSYGLVTTKGCSTQMQKHVSSI
jgi:hypothetical protein